MKNENGQKKSAILKGQTLDSYLSVEGDVELNKIYSLTKNFDNNTKYLFIVNVITLNDSGKIIVGEFENFSYKNEFTIGNLQLGLNKKVITTNVSCSQIKFDNTSTDLLFNQLMIIPYQDGMENWDIPYFEGMQSVKVPVLTTCGKNLWKTDLFDLANIDSFYQNTNYTLKQLCPDLIVGETYIASYNYQYTGTINAVVGIIALTNFISLSDKPFIYTEELGKSLIYLYGGNATGVMTNFQIEKGSVATPYEPYQSNTLTVNEPIELRGIGEVRDTLDLLTGEVTERIGEIILNGSSDEEWGRNGSLSDGNYLTSFFTISVSGSKRIIGSVTKKCDKLLVHSDYSHNNDVEGIHQVIDNQISIRILKTKLTEDSANGLKQWLQSNPITVQYQLISESIKPVNLTIKDQDNQPQERMKLFPNGYINTSSSTFPPILELKGITHNNKLNMTTTNGTNNTQLTTLDNLALDGIICRDGTVVRDSYDVESGLYTKRVFRFTIDEEFIERYRDKWQYGSNSVVFEFHIPQVLTGFPKPSSSTVGVSNNMAYMNGGNTNRVNISDSGAVYITILKEELKSYDVDGLLDWIKRNGDIEVAYQMATPQIIHMQPNMQPYVSTRPYQGSIESQGNILESSFLDYTSEQSIISPKPLGDGDVLRWEQGSQCYVYENDKEYIPLTDYNKPMGTVLDLEEEDGEQFVENLDGGDIIVDVPFKEKAVYERHLVSHEDNVIYPTQDKLDPTGKIEVDYICGETWQNPNDLSDIRHVGTLREDGQYDVTIRRSGDDEIRLMDGITHISLDGDGLNPSEFELTFFNSGGVEVGKYGDTSHTLEDCVLDSKLETGTVYGQTLVNVVDGLAQVNNNTFYSYDENSGLITILKDDGSPWNNLPNICSTIKPNTQYTIILYELNNLKTFQLCFNGKSPSVYSTPEVTITPNDTDRMVFKAFRTDTSKNGSFKMLVLEGDYTSYPMDIPYFEGVSSTIVNGFTVSNSDDTEMVKYTLPTSITLNKLGDVVDTYDVVSGVETRKLLNLVFDGSDDEAWSIMFEAYGTAKNKIYGITIPNMTKGKDNIFTGLFIANYKYIESLADSFIGTEEGHWGVYCVGDPQIRLITPTGTSREQLKEYLQANPLKVVIKTETPQTIQHTLIPSSIQTTQEPTIILPQPLRSVPNGICDRLYWDENKGHYCIEKRVEEVYVDGSQTYKHRNNGDDLTTITYQLKVKNKPLFDISRGYCHPMPRSQSSTDGVEGWGLDTANSSIFLEIKRDKLPEVNVNGFTQWIAENHQTVVYTLTTSEIIDLPYLNKKLTLPTQPDTLPIGYKVEHSKANPQLGLTIPYKQLNYPSRPQNIDFKMDIADYVLTWDDVKEARQYNIILNDRTIATVKEPQWNSGEEMYGYIMVEAQNELAENLSEELYIKTVPNAPAQLTVAHNPMTDYYDFEISFIKTSAIAEYYTVQYRIDGGEWVYKTIQSSEIDPNSKVLWRFSVYEINEQIEVWATATNDIGTNDILPTAIYYMSPTPQWTYKINSKELFVRWMDDSPYDVQYKLRYQYKSDGIYRYAYFEGDKQEIGKLYEALIPLADDEEVSIALCIISEKENLYTKPIKASKELDPNIKPPKNFNYHWLARGLIEFYWEDNYDVDVEYEAIVEHRLTSGNNEWITDTRIFSATDTEGTGTVYRLSYQLEDLEEIRVKVRMKWAMNETEWTESLTTVFIPVEGNPPQWIRRTQTQEGLLVEWEAQEYVDSYHVYVMSNGEELQHLETVDNFIYVDLDYSNPIDIEIYESTRFSGGIESDPTESMCFRPTMDKHQLIHDVVTPDTLTYEIEVDTVQKGIKERQVIHDINTTPKVTDKQPMDVAIKSPFTLSFHPLQLDVHQAGSKYYGDTELHIKTLDVKSRDAIEVLSFERITDQYGVDFTVYTPSASKYPITLEVNRVRIVCFGDSLTSGHPGFWMVI